MIIGGQRTQSGATLASRPGHNSSRKGARVPARILGPSLRTGLNAQAECTGQHGQRSPCHARPCTCLAHVRLAHPLRTQHNTTFLIQHKLPYIRSTVPSDRHNSLWFLQTYIHYSLFCILQLLSYPGGCSCARQHALLHQAVMTCYPPHQTRAQRE